MAEELTIILQQIKDESDYFTKAKLIRFLIDKKGLRIVEISKKLRMQPAYICHILRLNIIPELIIDGYYSKMISLSHLFVLSRLKNPQAMIDLYEQILKKALTVFQTEEKVRDFLHKIKTKGAYLSSEKMKEMVSRIKENYPSLEVDLYQTRIKSTMKLVLKGSLEETTPIIQEIARKITS